MDNLLSRTEVAEILACSGQTVSRLIKQGKLLAVKVGVRKIGITPDSFRAFLEGIGVKQIGVKQEGKVNE